MPRSRSHKIIRAPLCKIFLFSDTLHAEVLCSFDGWTFVNGIDTNTTGNVLYQTREQAASENLTFVNSAGNVIMKVDNTTNGANDPTFGRPSIKIMSNATIPAGSLVIMDAVHMPFGVSTKFPHFITHFTKPSYLKVLRVAGLLDAGTELA